MGSIECWQKIRDYCTMGLCSMKFWTRKEATYITYGYIDKKLVSWTRSAGIGVGDIIPAYCRLSVYLQPSWSPPLSNSTSANECLQQITQLMNFMINESAEEEEYHNLYEVTLCTYCVIPVGQGEPAFNWYLHLLERGPF